MNSNSIPQIAETEQLRKISSFDELNLNFELAHGIYSYGFQYPSEIQQLAIKPIIDGRHVIAQAQSGTGKTGAFSIGILQRIDISLHETQALVFAPTRELAAQIYQVFLNIGKHIKGLTIALIRGGNNVQESEIQASNLPHIVIATPGRALSLISNRFLNCQHLSVVCLDEADEMLSGRFMEQMFEIFQYLPQTVQLLIFSATIPPEISQLSEQLMIDPVKILVQEERLTLEGIQQYYIATGQTNRKWATLLRLYGSIAIQKAIIFANRTETVNYLVDQFSAENFGVSAIHSRLTQAERDRVMQDFRNGRIRVLVSTDLLGRGIDVQQVTLVVNFELPRNREQYLHRIGRSGRYGRKGIAINICDNDDMNTINQYQTFFNTNILELPANLNEIIHDVAVNNNAELEG